VHQHWFRNAASVQSAGTGLEKVPQGHQEPQLAGSVPQVWSAQYCRSGGDTGALFSILVLKLPNHAIGGFAWPIINGKDDLYHEKF
jgi:hypothetical protein